MADMGTEWGDLHQRRGSGGCVSRQSCRLASPTTFPAGATTQGVHNEHGESGLYTGALPLLFHGFANGVRPLVGKIKVLLLPTRQQRRSVASVIQYIQLDVAL